MIYVVMGVVASIAIFLYCLPLLRRDKKKRGKRDAHKVEISERAVKSDTKCPVCKKGLGESDIIYIERFPAQPKDKIFIKGCNFCFDPKTRKRIKK